MGWLEGISTRTPTTSTSRMPSAYSRGSADADGPPSEVTASAHESRDRCARSRVGGSSGSSSCRPMNAASTRRAARGARRRPASRRRPGGPPAPPATPRWPPRRPRRRARRPGRPRAAASTYSRWQRACSGALTTAQRSITAACGPARRRHRPDRRRPSGRWRRAARSRRGRACPEVVEQHPVAGAQRRGQRTQAQVEQAVLEHVVGGRLRPAPADDRLPSALLRPCR